MCNICQIMLTELSSYRYSLHEISSVTHKCYLAFKSIVNGEKGSDTQNNSSLSRPGKASKQETFLLINSV